VLLTLQGRESLGNSYRKIKHIDPIDICLSDCDPGGRIYRRLSYRLAGSMNIIETLAIFAAGWVCSMVAMLIYPNYAAMMAMISYGIHFRKDIMRG